MCDGPIELITPEPFLRKHGVFTEGEAAGSAVLHHDLAVWALREGVAERVWLVPDRLDVFSSPQPLEVMAQAVAELPREIRSRIGFASGPCLPESGPAGGARVVLGRASDLAHLAMLRECVLQGSPVCGIVHACLFPAALVVYYGAMLLAGDGDVLCAPSAAAKRATEALLREALCALGSASPETGPPLPQPIKVRHVPPGIDDSWLNTPDRMWARTLLGVLRDEHVILTFGRISREYKADLAPLLLAFRKVWQRNRKAILIVGGSVVHGRPDYLQNLLVNYELGSSVRVYQNVDPVLKRAMFAAADVFVAPSDNVQESFGLALLEAMATGLPIVASDWSGHRELIEHGKNGFLVETFVSSDAWTEASVLACYAVPPHAEYRLAAETIVDAEQLAQYLEMLLNNEQLRLQLGDVGRRKVATEYVWSKAIHRFGQVWRDAVQQGNATTGRHRRLLDLRRVFGQYPSRHWPPAHTCFVHLSSLADDTVLARLPMDEHTAQILDGCARAAVPLASLLQQGPATQKRLFWLLKKGVLTIRHTPA